MPVRQLLSVAVFLLASAGSSMGAAQTSPQAHPGEYAPADIAYGSRLYDAQCTTCHGANGDGVGGVDLRSGKFRNAVTDQDLIRVITTGIPGTGMQAFKFDAVRDRRDPRLPPQHELLRSRLGQGRRRPARPHGRRKEGRLHQLSPRRRAGLARRARPQRRRRHAKRGIAAAFADRSDQPDDADQPSGARRHARRQGRSTAGG